MGISTAVESTAFASMDVISDLLPHIDCFLMDIKHMNSKKHIEYTGKSNERILQNAYEIAKQARRLVIRVPVIPGFNDSEGEIADIASFAAGLHNVKEMNLLPYHRMGSDKYRWLGREYLLEGVMPPENEHMERLRETAEKCGIFCKIGG